MDSFGSSRVPVFKTISGKNYMEFTFNNASELIGYQLEMIAHNSIEGLLGCEILRIDGRVHLAYDITSLIPLGKLFERKVFVRSEFLALIGQITELLRVLNDYLLDSGRLVFDNQYIFIDPQSLKLSLAYLPQRDGPDNLEPLKNMLLETIIHQVRFANEKTDNFIQKLIELLKEKELTASTLQEYAKDMEAVGSALSIAPTLEVKRENNPSMEEKTKAKAVPSIPRPMVQPGIAQKATETRMGFPSKSYFVMGSIILAFLAFGVLLVTTKTLSPDNPDFFLSLFGFLLIGGALLYLVYTKLFSLDKRVELKVENKPVGAQRAVSETGSQASTPKKQTGMRTSLYLPSQRMVPDTVDMSKPVGDRAAYVNKAFSSPQPLQARQEAAITSEDVSTRIGPKKEAVKGEERVQDRTMLLDANHLKYPTLQRVRGGEGLLIPITHFPFMIGRLSGQVDYCLNNPAIGKMHVELKKTEEGIFVTDMNSRNGTWVNGERIEPSRDFRLEHGAHLTVANEEFIFNQSKGEGE